MHIFVAKLAAGHRTFVVFASEYWFFFFLFCRILNFCGSFSRIFFKTSFLSLALLSHIQHVLPSIEYHWPNQLRSPSWFHTPPLFLYWIYQNAHLPTLMTSHQASHMSGSHQTVLACKWTSPYTMTAPGFLGRFGPQLFPKPTPGPPYHCLSCPSLVAPTPIPCFLGL